MAKVALVTGAGTGIGRAAALALAEAGYAVALVGRREEPLRETAAQAGSARTLVLPADVSDAAAVDQVFERTVAEFGRLDVLFNNAGRGAPPVPVDELSVEDWLAVVNVNLTGAFLCARAAFGIMRRQDPQGGRIINNGSISAHVPRPFSAPYTATKHAITGLTRSLSLDGRAFDIACGQIDIGNAATEMTDRMAAGILQATGETMVEPRMDVAEVARAVVHMASLPLSANIQFMTIMATKMPYIGRG
ncbi:SDR family oxidoreductase [Caenispirillum bisanense]|uniref:NADP-dependent 3-hydroxy acid dehydrogenase YdfG n=1 Tax=Caenispirillum bisanense TaxID=414052 RepID=A0A286G3K9_9PROT|nr:SDR family oxidoreductase [Caenispirillum bisanense]SOD90157.1 NADP-dependent 3-hydroxy acid dehydrogenase YdfG [Caenispirillum bisanense]